MVKTPTFYVFKMYKVHQDATLLPINLTCEDYTFDGMTLPSVTASASKDSTGKIHISLGNINPNKDVPVEVDLRGGKKLSKATGEIITGTAMNSYNDFDKPEEVNIKSFSQFKFKDNLLQVTLLSKSVVTIEIE
jgi:alpha-N-arabinofuranosidase